MQRRGEVSGRFDLDRKLNSETSLLHRWAASARENWGWGTGAGRADRWIRIKSEV